MPIVVTEQPNILILFDTPVNRILAKSLVFIISTDVCFRKSWGVMFVIISNRDIYKWEILMCIGK